MSDKEIKVTVTMQDSVRVISVPYDTPIYIVKDRLKLSTATPLYNLYGQEVPNKVTLRGAVHFRTHITTSSTTVPMCTSPSAE